MKNNPLPRLDTSSEWRDRLLPHCRLKAGGVWRDPAGKHVVGCLDATDLKSVKSLVGDVSPTLAIHDPPYNLVAFERRSIGEYTEWSRRWVRITHDVLAHEGSLYVWLGADQRDGFQPLADFIVMMREEPFAARSFITMRNQRGYGTQKNWMAVRQELLYYVKGSPAFNVEAEYTDIPKILRGYYKEVNGCVTENLERSKSDTIRAGNVWVDIQQVFYRMEENVSGCYAQKPLKCIERIIRASSQKGDVILDFFAHSGSTLLAAEMLDRRCITTDIDPIYCEISIRRLERYRQTGRLGWQNGHPFEKEFPDAIDADQSELLAAPNRTAPLPMLFE
ncbi:MAG: site-specific DNA-methyltransferase [Planctomycetes bacterium]|nr:site-specific DNA-methyltransferase [Planctomycetota bacterium]